MQAALHRRSTEAEVREILTIAVKPEARARLSEALAALSRDIGLTNEDFEVFERVRDKAPAMRAWLNAQAAPTLYLSSVTLAELAVMARAGGRGFPTPDRYIAAIAASRDTAPFQAAGVVIINPWEA